MGLAATFALTLVIILFVWLAGNALGFHVSLIGSLAVSLGLTLILSLILGAVSRHRRRATES